MSKINNVEDRIYLEIGSNNETASNNQSEAIDARDATIERGKS